MKKTPILITLIVFLLFLSGGTFAYLIHSGQAENAVPGSSGGSATYDSLGSTISSLVKATAGFASTVDEKPKPDGSTGDTVDPADHIIAHRGTSGESKEHSFEAYDEAIAQGAKNIEQDIVISKDGTLYVSHDLNAGRMTGNNRDFSSMSDPEIDALTTGAGNPVLRLGDVFDKYGDTVMYVVELKDSDNSTIDAFSNLVNEHGLSGNITAQCFQPDALKILKERYPDMPMLYLCRDRSGFEEGFDLPYVDIVSVRYDMMSEDIVNRIHDAGKQASAWTLDREETIAKAIDLGVDIYFTDNVSRAISMEKELRSSSSSLDDSGSGGSKRTGSSTILFASDYQKVDGWPDPSESFSRTLKSAIDDGKKVNGVVLCGDYTNDRKLHDYQLSPEESIDAIKKEATDQVPSIDDGDLIFIQGNHDKLTGSIASTGLHEYGDCLIYVLNTENDFPWKQGKVSGCLSKVEKSSKDMKNAFDKLIENGEKRPVLIAGHVPLHFTARTSSKHTTGDNLYSSLIFNAVNEAAEKLDIVYFFGHNHSKGWDCYMGGSSVYKAVGDKVLIPAFDKNDVSTDRFTEETLNFTYLNAGYIGYYMNCGPEEADMGIADRYAAADGTLTSTVCEILPDEIKLTRYSADGIHPLGWNGEGDPYKDHIDRGLIDEKYYSKKTESPVIIKRKR